MRKLFHITFPFSLFLLLFIGSCDNIFSKEDTIPVENTTQFAKSDAEKKHYEIDFQKHYPDADTFMLVDAQKKQHKITAANKKVFFHENVNSIVIVNFFSTWCSPCLAQLTYLNDLQKKHEDSIFLTSVLVHERFTPLRMKEFLKEQNLHYFIAIGNENDLFASLVAKSLFLHKNYDIPLTVMYINGHYFTHYEGIVPIEMIEYDIQQAKKKLIQ